MEEASDRGLDGLIIPDLPIEESVVISEQCRKNGIHLIPLLAPTSTEERIKSSCEHAGGFIYCVSLTGVTGAREGLSVGVEGLVEKIRIHTDLPVLVGFGVSQKKDVAVVGSAFLDHIASSSDGNEISAAGEFIDSILVK